MAVDPALKAPKLHQGLDTRSQRHAGSTVLAGSGDSFQLDVFDSLSYRERRTPYICMYTSSSADEKTTAYVVYIYNDCHCRLSTPYVSVYISSQEPKTMAKTPTRIFSTPTSPATSATFASVAVSNSLPPDHHFLPGYSFHTPYLAPGTILGL